MACLVVSPGSASAATTDRAPAGAKDRAAARAAAADDRSTRDAGVSAGRRKAVARADGATARKVTPEPDSDRPAPRRSADGAVKPGSSPTPKPSPSRTGVTEPAWVVEAPPAVAGATAEATPTIVSLANTRQLYTGDGAIGINGTGFLPDDGTTTITIGGVVASHTRESTTYHRAFAPAGPQGQVVDLILTNANGSTAPSADTKIYYVDQPTVTSVTPDTGLTAGGGTVTVTGTNFIGTMAVTFGSVDATSFTVDSNTQITATVPPLPAGEVDVVVSLGTVAMGTFPWEATMASPAHAGSKYNVQAAPAVTTQPVDQTVDAGQLASFTAAASGTPTPTVSWQVSTDSGDTWTPIDGATSTTYSFTAQAADTGNRYRAVFTNTLGPATSDPATLTVVTLPAAPTGVTVTAGVSSISVSWSAATPHGGPVTGYTAIANPGPATCTTTGATTCILGASAGVPYTVTVVAHSASGSSAPSAASSPVTVAAPTPPPTPPVTPLTLTTDRGSISVAEPGQRIVFVGTGFLPHSTVAVTLYSSPVTLGSAVTDAAGSFSQEVTIPKNLASGSHTVSAQGVAPDGSVRVMALEISVAAQAGDGLPVTGPGVMVMVAVGLSLMVTGGGLVRVGRPLAPARRVTEAARRVVILPRSRLAVAPARTVGVGLFVADR